MSEIDDLRTRIQELEAEALRLRKENQTSQTNLEFLVIARTEQLQATLRELERSYDMTLETLGDSLDLIEAKKVGHTRRVCLFTIAISQALGLPREKIVLIPPAAILRDIGKMTIPDTILRKPGKLTPDETAIMQQHPYRGYQILNKIPFLAEASEIVWALHERYDGTGYPRGLKGEQIPLGARIAAVANTLDSIAANPYRSAWSLKAARAEIERSSGRQFDPEIVRVFLEMPDAIWEDLRREIDAGNGSEDGNEAGIVVKKPQGPHSNSGSAAASLHE